MGRWLKRIALLSSAVLVVAVAAGWWLLRGSLPALDGEIALDGLSAPVSVQRDALGVVTIAAGNEHDAMRALGYVHAQERFFEMDLMRRSAAGELAELFGPIALDLDRQHRVHRLRARAHAALDAIAGDRKPQLLAYTEGVNAGLRALRVRPWPYLLLRQSPRAWVPEDSALVGDAMYFDLQDAQGKREFSLWRIRQHVPAALYALLAHDGSRWDAALQGDAHGDAALPSPAELDLRRLPAPGTLHPFATAEEPFNGSNHFAVAGALTRDHRAILANDMHLGLRAPNIWFRARLRYPQSAAPAGQVDVQGFTLPGLPMVIVGSNGHVAWGFTNSYVDTTDWKAVVPCTKTAPAASDRPCDTVVVHRETIRIAGKAPVTLDVRESAWGPVLQEIDGRAYALRWTAHLPGAINFGLSGFAGAHDLDDALAIADHSAVPTQNLMLADANGRIAWRLLGPLPVREGGCATQHLVEGTGGVDEASIAPAPAPAPAQAQASASASASASALALASGSGSGSGSIMPSTDSPATAAAVQPCNAWRMADDRSPSDVDPPQSRLWTANNRVVDDEALARVGNGGYDLGARARQIRDGLFAKQRFTERDLLAIQLDDRALFLAPWWQLLQRQAAATPTPALTALAKAAEQAPQRADPASVSYRLVRAWHRAVIARIVDGLTAPAQAALGEAFTMPPLAQIDGVAYPLATQQPQHLLPRRYACAAQPTPGCSDADGWSRLMDDAARKVRDGLAGEGPLDQRNWGERNTAHVCHPLAAAIPLVGERLLCMPADRLHGDDNMPRVAKSSFGASERMVVSPGHEADGIVHMPGGQSGHPLSPFWGAGHEDWVQGRATPFLPGVATHTLRMMPAVAPP